MNNREVEMTDVIVVLDDLTDEQTLEVVGRLKTAGLCVESVDNDNSVVEGCVETARLHDLQKVGCVRYVRSVFTYEAEVPPRENFAKATTKTRTRIDRTKKPRRTLQGASAASAIVLSFL